MTQKFACSACHALFAAGTTTCPNCQLPLSAQALRVEAPQKRRMAIWPFILGALVFFVILANVLDHAKESKVAAQRVAFIADLQAGKLSTPEAFEARCGMPANVDGSELHYVSGRDFFVHFEASRPVLQSGYNVGKKKYRRPVNDEEFFSLHCQ